MPPNVKRLDPPPSKKAKVQQAPPEVHIALNIAPTLGAGGDMSYVVSQTPVTTSAAGPSCPEEVGSSPPPPPGRKLHIRKATHALALALAKCTEMETMLSTKEVLTLLDSEDPQPDGKYIDSLDELTSFGVLDAIDIYRMEECLLATLGYLDRGGARSLCQFTKKKILIPLGLHHPDDSPTPSIQAIGRPDNFTRIHNWRSEIREEDDIKVVEDKDGGAEEDEIMRGGIVVKDEADEIEDEADEVEDEDEVEVEHVTSSEV